MLLFVNDGFTLCFNSHEWKKMECRSLVELFMRLYVQNKQLFIILMLSRCCQENGFSRARWMFTFLFIYSFVHLCKWTCTWVHTAHDVLSSSSLSSSSFFLPPDRCLHSTKYVYGWLYVLCVFCAFCDSIYYLLYCSFIFYVYVCIRAYDTLSKLSGRVWAPKPEPKSPNLIG